MVPSKAVRITIHIAGWLLFFSLIIGFIGSNSRDEIRIKQFLSIPYLLFFSLYIFIFYFNSELLIPALYLQRKYFYYFFIILLFFAAVYFLQPFDQIIRNQEHRFDRLPPSGMHGFPPPPDMHRLPPSRSPEKIDIVSIVLFIMVWSLSTALQIIKQWRRSEQRAVRAEADKAQAELSFLKAQINPHFLFNTLNNIYSQAITKSENTGDSIMKLSNIMRYLTDEAGQDFVPLKNEVNCIKDYIDLQRMRLSNKVQLEFNVTGDLEGKLIAPLILMSFIENVFKYGVSSHEESNINIQLSTGQNSIIFRCQNKIIGSMKNEDRTGIGISNTKQRLEFLYPGKHILHISTDSQFYIVELTLKD